MENSIFFSNLFNFFKNKQTERIEKVEQENLPQSSTFCKPDHSLALIVADQIIAIERSVKLIDKNTKGLQRIKNSVTVLRDNLFAHGYEMPELIGKQYNQGMNIIIESTITDEKLQSGEEIITRIIKPQVNFKDIMIQAAKIELSVGV